MESNPPDEEKKAINSFYDATSYNLNGDYFDSQVSIQNLFSTEASVFGSYKRVSRDRKGKYNARGDSLGNLCGEIKQFF